MIHILYPDNNWYGYVLNEIGYVFYVFIKLPDHCLMIADIMFVNIYATHKQTTPARALV